MKQRLAHGRRSPAGIAGLALALVWLVGVGLVMAQTPAVGEAAALERYDADGNGAIDKVEFRQASLDYFAGDIDWTLSKL